jgi:aspartyl-tRNA(Asn)/glutamyl-tRNA(Gln) amidotransferase subunit C
MAKRVERLSISDIEKIASLAKIGLTDEEKSRMTIELNSILGFVDDIQKTNTTDVEQTSQITGLTNVLREDTVYPCELKREDLLRNAPSTQDGYIKVKRVM